MEEWHIPSVQLCFLNPRNITKIADVDRSVTQCTWPVTAIGITLTYLWFSRDMPLAPPQHLCNAQYVLHVVSSSEKACE